MTNRPTRRVLSWNIRSGGKGRSVAIADAIIQHSADVVVLGEYRRGGSAQVIDLLAKAGFESAILTSPPRTRGGLAILSRYSLRQLPVSNSLSRFTSRFLSVEVAESSLVVVGLYGLLKTEPYSVYWPAALSEVRQYANRPTLVVGDFNTGQSVLDAPRKSFYCSNYFGQLSSLGFTDEWRRHNGQDTRDYSWYGRRYGYRLDHAFGSGALGDRVADCRYSHGERLEKLSDHSMLLIDVRA